MKIKIIMTLIFLLVSSVGWISNVFLKSQTITLERNYVSIIVEGEVKYKYYLPITKNTTARDAVVSFGLLPTSDIDDLYLKISRSWYEIGGNYVLEEDARLKVGKK